MFSLQCKANSSKFLDIYIFDMQMVFSDLNLGGPWTTDIPTL